MKLSPQQEQQLMVDLFSFNDDMLGAIMYAFPWGEPGPLLHEEGPDEWQRRLADEISEHVIRNKERKRNGDALQPFQKAISSGHGIGKSAFFGWFDWWMMSTRPGSGTVVTANKESQLKGKTWPELRKWITLSINSHWFDVGAMSLRPAPWFAKLVREQLKIDEGKWAVNAETWSEENPAAFQGLHNDFATGIIYDEASGIPAPIWEASLGALTDANSEIFWLVFGNPNENSGPFFECFNRFRHRWNPQTIDSRSVKRTNKEFLQQIADDYGEDDDVTRVRVKGEFPRQGENQFLNSEAILEAARREPDGDDPGAPLVMGVDIARFGAGRSVIRLRQGRNAKTLPRIRLQNTTTVTVAGEIAQWIDRYEPDAVFVDGGGLGAGPCDVLKDRGYRIQEVNFGERAEEQERFPDRRTEMWWRLGEWLPSGCIEDDRDLVTDLRGPYREYDGRGRIKLESKDKMARRGLDSPDDGDALALTFASRVARRDTRHSRHGRRLRMAQGLDYSPI